MKKLFILLLFIPSLCLSQTDSFTVDLKPQDKLTLNKVYEDVKTGIQGLAKALKQPVEHVYIILVRQQLIYSITWTLLIILCIIIWFCSIKMINNAKDWDLPAPSGVIGIILSIINMVFTIIILSKFNGIITGYINPEYGAIKDIIDFVKD